MANCEHVTGRRLNARGEIFCRLCDAVYIITLGGCAWIARRPSKQED